MGKSCSGVSISKILVTGATGFIGSQVTRILIARSDEVVGIDNLNNYYDPRLKEARLDWIRTSAGGERFRVLLAASAWINLKTAAEEWSRVERLKG